MHGNAVTALPTASQERLFRPDAIALIYKTINSDQFPEVGHLITDDSRSSDAERAMLKQISFVDILDARRFG